MDRKRSPEIEPAGKQARILLILISSMSVLVAQTFPGNDRGKLTRSAIFDVARFKSRHLSFPRSEPVKKSSRLPIPPLNGAPGRCSRASLFPYASHGLPNVKILIL